MNKNTLKDIALLATAALIMGAFATAPSAEALADTVRAKAHATIDQYVPQTFTLSNAPTIGQAFSVVESRDRI